MIFTEGVTYKYVYLTYFTINRNRISVRPQRHHDVERTPPLFSKHEEIRAAGAGMTYSPQRFGITEDEQFLHAPDFFAGKPGRYL